MEFIHKVYVRQFHDGMNARVQDEGMFSALHGYWYGEAGMRAGTCGPV